MFSLAFSTNAKFSTSLQGERLFSGRQWSLLGRMPSFFLLYDLDIVHYVLSSSFALSKQDPDKGMSGKLTKGKIYEKY